MDWLIIVLLLLLAAGLLFAIYYWVFTITEGVYFGRGLVVWLYDVTAHKYDQIKAYDAADENILVVEPILGELRQAYRPLVLDVATGTGRVPQFLLADGRFQNLLEGHLIGIDASPRMLRYAVQNLASYPERVDWVQQAAVPLAFPNCAFDCVVSLESLEFFPNMEQALKEMVRVLRPGCSLLVTRRTGWEARFFFGRYRSPQNFAAWLRELGLEEISIYPWQSNYDLVVARKVLSKKR